LCLDGDRAALLRRYNAAKVTNAPATDDVTVLSDFDGPKKVSIPLQVEVKKVRILVDV
jgi:hypothetical protein